MKMQTKWNLKLLYKSPKDPQIQRDLDIITKTCETFATVWKGNDTYMTDERMLYNALQDFGKAAGLVKAQKPGYYFYLLCDTDKKNAYANAQNTKIGQEIVKASNLLLFFDVNLAQITPANQKKFLTSSLLKEYRYFLKCCFDKGRYKLSEAEEKVISLLGLPAYSAWVDGVGKQLADQKIKWKGRDIGLGEADYAIPVLPRPDRLKLHAMITGRVRAVAPFAEAEINAIYTTKKTTDELRKFPHAYSEMILENENDEKQIIGLVDLVTKYFPIAQKFYKLKRKLMRISGKLSYVDINARVGVLKRSFSFADSCAITEKAFGEVDPEFQSIFKKFLKNGQIDAFPKIGKTSGAHCLSTCNLPVYVLLNHTPSLDSLKTIAHEMGHAIHAELSASQPVFYQGINLSTGESASTLFENFVFEEVFKTLSKKEQIVALHDRIQDAIATIFRQIAFFNFEKDLHIMIRKEGFVAKDKISALMNKHLLSYIGSDFKLDLDDGLFWIRLSHMRSFFYVYTYAYGLLVSKAMYAKYKEDKSFVEKIKHFLRAGGSKSPEDIFKDIGIDTSKPAFWVAGLKTIEEDIKKLERLAFK